MAVPGPESSGHKAYLIASGVPIGLILTLLDIDPFHGGKSARPGRRGARRDAGPPESQMAGKRRPIAPWAPGRADVPHPREPGAFYRQRRPRRLAVSRAAARERS